MSAWKWIGLAGVVGAAAVGVATGAVVVQRRRREFHEVDPVELRDRLHDRLAEADERAAATTA